MVMNKGLHSEITDYLKAVDEEKAKTQEYSYGNKISERIKTILNKNSGYEASQEDLAEMMAFDYMQDYKNNSWNTYYGPMFTGRDKNGQIVEYPSLSKVDQVILDYWASRSEVSKNPILISRYADLVVDFSPVIVGKGAAFELIKKVINSNIEICKNLMIHPVDCKTKIKRALNLAIGLNNQDQINKVKEAIIDLEKKVASDDKAGLWGFSFRWLLLDFSKKIVLNQVEESKLVNEMEDRLSRVEKDIWLTEHAVVILAQYYAKKNDESNLVRVLGILEKSLKEDDRSNSEPLLKTHAYEKMQEIYQQYSDKGFKQIRDANARILKEMAQLELNWQESMKEISTSIEIKKDDIDALIKWIFGENKENDLELIVAKIAINLLPTKESMKLGLDSLVKTNPLSYMVTTQIIPYSDGVPIAKISSITEDYDNHFQRYASQHLEFSSIYLSIVLEELKKLISKQEFLGYFASSMLFKKENKKYLERAISAYFENDYLVSSHLFIPLIESAVRELVRISGGVILKANKIGGYDQMPLGSLLSGQGGIIINSIYDKIYKEMGFYFQLVLTSSCGMNLRDDFAHGLGKAKFLTKEVSDRLFHIILCLLLIKEKSDK
jgi:hypothetical protein